jgi:putative intracellular protease/amidase
MKLKGKKATSYISIKDDMINAGARWEDSEMSGTQSDNRTNQMTSPPSVGNHPGYGRAIVGISSRQKE